MIQNITISRTTGTRALLTALLAIVVLLVARTAENVLAVLKLAKVWLTTPHRYDDGDGGVIEWNGVQVIVFGLAVCAGCLLSSIEI